MWDFQVELYKASNDGEGWQYLGSNNTDAGGRWVIEFNGQPGCYTAVQTAINNSTGARMSSQFAPVYCTSLETQYLICVPIISRP